MYALYSNSKLQSIYLNVHFNRHHTDALASTTAHAVFLVRTFEHVSHGAEVHALEEVVDVEPRGRALARLVHGLALLSCNRQWTRCQGAFNTGYDILSTCRHRITAFVKLSEYLYIVQPHVLVSMQVCFCSL